MFKGFDKAKDIQYVYTPVFSSLCGVKLDSNNKAGYLLSGTVSNETFYIVLWKKKQVGILVLWSVKREIFLNGFSFGSETIHFHWDWFLSAEDSAKQIN